jgi:hypothetical protein
MNSNNCEKGVVMTTTIPVGGEFFQWALTLPSLTPRTAEALSSIRQGRNEMRVRYQGWGGGDGESRWATSGFPRGTPPCSSGYQVLWHTIVNITPFWERLQNCKKRLLEILANNPTWRTFSCIYLFIYLFHVSTCFERHSVDHQEIELY